MNKDAELLNQQGLRLVQEGKLTEALEFFTKAIETDPSYPDAHHHRGETYVLLNRLVEGNTDIQRAKDIRQGKLRFNKQDIPKTNISINEVESIYDTVFPSDEKDAEREHLEFKDEFYDYVFSDDAIESEESWEQLAQSRPEEKGFPAILEYLNGKRKEVVGAILFRPTINDISLVRQDGYVERVIPLDQLACIRIAGLPVKLAESLDPSAGNIEIIETVNENIYHESINPEQKLENVLIGFSTKEQTRFIYSIIPTVNIKKRCQQRFLGDILLEKKFIANDILKNALDELQHVKNMKLGKILAQKAHVEYSVIEEELEKAQKGSTQGLKTGEILLFSGLVNEEQVLEALEDQENMQNKKIGEFLVEKGIIHEKEVYLALAEKFNIPFVDLRKQKVSKNTLSVLSRKLVVENEILPISSEDGVLKIATHNPDDHSSVSEEIMKECKCDDLEFVLAQPTHLRNVINLLYKKIGLGL